MIKLNYSILVRFFIVLGTILTVYFANIDYGNPLILASLAYLVLYIIVIEAENRSWIKFLFLGIDMLFISTIIYFTGFHYLSVFIIPLIVDFIDSKKDIFMFSLFATIPIAISLYISNFTDILFIPLIFAGLAGFFKLKSLINKKEKELKKIREDIEEIYIQNIKYQDRLEENKKILSTLNLLNDLQEGKLNLKQFIFILKEILSADDIVFFDYIKSKCVSTDRNKCDKSILKYIKDNPQIFTKSLINEKFDAEYIVSVVLENKKGVIGVIFFIYKLKPRDAKLVYKLISDYAKIIDF
ncbi:MAG: hypothetical protein DSY53_04150 [Persephonella sp.]|nr:MAG: hypothetical protein DSY53_04150 [Persephonella sp.]